MRRMLGDVTFYGHVAHIAVICLAHAWVGATMPWGFVGGVRSTIALRAP